MEGQLQHSLQNRDSEREIKMSLKELQVCNKSMLDNHLMICLASGLVLQSGGEGEKGADWSPQEDKYLLTADKLPVCLDGLVRNVLTVLQTVTVGIIKQLAPVWICFKLRPASMLRMFAV